MGVSAMAIAGMAYKAGESILIRPRDHCRGKEEKRVGASITRLGGSTELGQEDDYIPNAAQRG
jgi:hypothetical protein